MHIKGRHALVTGGSQGIGVDIAREFSRRGAAVTVLGRDAERLSAVAESINGNWSASISPTKVLSLMPSARWSPRTVPSTSW
jgi:short-subunit dehydrogenase